MSVLDRRTAEQILGRKAGEGGSTPDQLVGISGENVKAHREGFKSLSFSGIESKDPQFMVAPLYHPAAKMVIGMDKLRHLHLYFAFAQKKIYVTAAQ